MLKVIFLMENYSSSENFKCVLICCTIHLLWSFINYHLPGISSVSLQVGARQLNICHCAHNFKKKNLSLKSLSKSCPQGRTPRVSRFLTTLSMFPRMAHRPQQAWVTADAAAKPDLGSAGTRHWQPQWLKRAFGGNF